MFETNREMLSCSFGFNFNKINTFAIERCKDNDSYVTVIGYLDKDGEVKEWHLECDQTTHEELVKQWRQAQYNDYTKATTK